MNKDNYNIYIAEYLIQDKDIALQYQHSRNCIKNIKKNNVIIKKMKTKLNLNQQLEFLL